MDENVKQCKYCHRFLPGKFEGDVCPVCKENELFSRVREYIRKNEVNEYMVANEFQIPLRQVRGWIKEGRIEYAEIDTRIVGTKCQRCGKPVSFGSLCSDCMRLLNYSNNKIHLVENTDDKHDDKMRFLQE